MSTSVVRKQVSQAILRKLSSKNNRKLRRVVQRSGKPQVFSLPDLNFINQTIDGLNSSEKYNTNFKKVRLTKQNLKKARDIAKQAQDRFVKNEGKSNVKDTALFKYLDNPDVRPDLAAGVLAGNTFLIQSFRTATTIKKKIVDELLGDLSKESRALISRKIDRGHGTEGGDAVSTLQIAQAAQSASTLGVKFEDIPGLEDYLISEMEQKEIDLTELEVVKSVSTEYSTLVTKKGDLRARYVPKVTLQDWASNQGLDAKTEKFILTTLRKFFENPSLGLENMSGSPSIVDKVEMALTDGYTKLDKRNKNVRAKIAKKGNYYTKQNKVAKSGSLKNKASIKDRTTKASKPQVSSRVGSSELSVTKLLGYLNARINTRIIDNMNEPQLVNRTGRFASSVKVVNVIKTPQGYPSIAYTYQRNPYETFEQGNRLGSIHRDPRRLIDFTIREIAAEIITGRLYTRRV